MEQDELLRYTVDALDELGLRYALVGSFASGIWGETRFTQDIDIVIDLQALDVEPLCERFPADDFYVSPVAIKEAVLLGRPFNVIHPSSGNKIAFFVLGQTQWAQLQLDRRRPVEFSPDCTGYVATPEDVILGKLQYFLKGGSEKHLRDIAGILKISGNLLDRDHIELYAQQPGVTAVWDSVVEQCERPF